MLRACRRVLRPGGRIAFYTIFTPQGLSAAERRRAARDGPPAVNSRGRNPADLLRSSGFVDIHGTDVTDEFLTTSDAWYECRKRFADQLSDAEGRAAFEERQQENRVQTRAAKDGLLRRGLFAAQRPG